MSLSPKPPTEEWMRGRKGRKGNLGFYGKFSNNFFKRRGTRKG